MTREMLYAIRQGAIMAAEESDSHVMAVAFIELANAADKADAVIARHLHEGTVEYLDSDEDEDEGEESDGGETPEKAAIPKPDMSVEDLVD